MKHSASQGHHAFDGTGISTEVHHPSIGIVDEDRTTLSHRIAVAFFPPYFNEPVIISAAEVEPMMNKDKLMFVINIPAGFRSDAIASRKPEIQVNIDATVVMQANIGATYIQNIVNGDGLSTQSSKTFQRI